MQMKWSEILKSIAEAPTEELCSCPSSLLEKVRDKLHNVQEQSVPSGGDNQTTFTKPATLLQSLLKGSMEISKFLKLDLQKAFNEGLASKSVDPRIADIKRTKKSTTFDQLRFVFSCWTLFLDHKKFIPGKTPHQSSFKSFALSLGTTATEVVKYGVKKGAEIDVYIKTFNGFGILPLLPFIKWKKVGDDEVSQFAKLCHESRTIKRLLKVGAQAYAQSETIYRISLQRREGHTYHGVQQLGADAVDPPNAWSPDTASEYHSNPQPMSAPIDSTLHQYPIQLMSAPIDNTLHQYPIQLMSAPIDSTLHQYPIQPTSAPIDSTLHQYPIQPTSAPIDSTLHQYPIQSTSAPIDSTLHQYPIQLTSAPIDSTLHQYPIQPTSAPIDSTLHQYPSEQLENPQPSLCGIDGSHNVYQGVAFNHSLSSIVHPQNTLMNNLA
jgi:hypothetical protein